MSTAMAPDVSVKPMALLGDEDIAAALERLDWERDGDSLVRTIERKNFAEAMELVNGVAQLAEGANHHPDIDIRWNKITLRLSTHSEGGLTDKDVQLASSIDDLAAG